MTALSSTAAQAPHFNSALRYFYFHTSTILKEKTTSAPAGMTSNHRRQGDQGRPQPPDVVENVLRYPTPTAFQDQQAGQVNQGSGSWELYSVASSQGQICNLSQSSMWSYGNTTNTGLPNAFEQDDQDPDQYANRYKHHHQSHSPHQDPTQDSNPYLNEGLNTHQGLVNYHTVDMGGLSEGSSEPSLTSFSYWGNRLGPSQPGATSQDQRAQGRYREHLILPDPSSRSFAPAVPQYHEPERHAPGDEQPYSSCDDYHLRLSLAVGERFCDIAVGLGRTEESVVAFSEQEGLFWTQEEDDVLRESMMEDNSPSCDAMNHLMENGRRFEEEIFKRAKAVALWDEAAREAAQAEIPQPHHLQSPVSSQRSGSVETRSSEESGAEIEQDPEERGPVWTHKEIRILEEWKAQHPNTWKGVGNLLSGRTYGACTNKWRKIHPEEIRTVKYWRSEEIDRLNEWVAGHDYWPNKKELSVLLPHRDKKACVNRWFSHGKPWTDEEDNYLSSLQVQEDTDWNVVAANTSMQKERSGREAYICYGYLEDCRIQGKSSKSLGRDRNMKSSG